LTSDQQEKAFLDV